MLGEPPPTKGQLRVKALTALATVALGVTLVLVDWDDGSGRPNVFTGLKPALKEAASKAFAPPEQQTERPRSA